MPLSSFTPPRHVLITGASTGIGFACALDLAACGFSVHAGVRRDRDGARLLEAAAARGLADRVAWLPLDVTDEAAVNRAAVAVGAACDGRLAALVNNAGVVLAAPLEAMDMADLRSQMEVNFIGAASVTRACLPLLRAFAAASPRPRAARVVMMSSIAGKASLPFAWPYSASKHAMEALADGLRVELGPQGIDTVLVEPGAIKTPIWDKSVRAGEQRVDTWAPGLQQLYGARLQAFAELAKQAGERGISAEHVCRAVRLALLSRTPRVRYLVGNDARSRMWLGRLLPARWIDWALTRAVRGRGPTARS